MYVLTLTLFLPVRAYILHGWSLVETATSWQMLTRPLKKQHKVSDCPLSLFYFSVRHPRYFSNMQHNFKTLQEPNKLIKILK